MSNLRPILSTLLLVVEYSTSSSLLPWSGHSLVADFFCDYSFVVGGNRKTARSKYGSVQIGPTNHASTRCPDPTQRYC